MAKLTGKKLLANILDETTKKGFIALDKTLADKLVADGLIETNPGMPVGSPDYIAARATDKLKSQLEGAATAATQETKTVATTETKFTITKNDTLPPAAPRGGFARGSQYPFEALEIGDSFFVPKTAEMENPARTLSSAVTAAMKRAGKIVGSKPGKKEGTTIPVYEYTKKYVVRPVDGGAKVYRVADNVPESK